MRRTTFFLLGVLIAGTPDAALATCYHGCADVTLNVGDKVYITQSSEASCSPSCGTGGTLYRLQVRDNGSCTGELGTYQTFCSTEIIPTEVTYEVNSIGSGCSGTPQGCVRICEPCQ